MNTLNIRLIKDRNDRTISVIENFPGLYAEMNSDQMRAMARALICAAENCDAHRSGKQMSFDLKTGFPKP